MLEHLWHKLSVIEQADSAVRTSGDNGETAITRWHHHGVYYRLYMKENISKEENVRGGGTAHVAPLSAKRRNDIRRNGGITKHGSYQEVCRKRVA